MPRWVEFLSKTNSEINNNKSLDASLIIFLPKSYQKVFRKTFQERRTYFAVYRAFYRYFVINITAFHLFMMQARKQQRG